MISVFNVKENALENQTELELVDMIILVDIEIYKKLSTQVSNSIYAIVNDFKNYLIEAHNTINDDFLNLNLVYYNNKYLSENKVFKFNDQENCIKTLESAETQKDSTFYGPIDAFNSIKNINLRENSMRFVFHFAGENAQETLQDKELDLEELRDKFKYELIFLDTLDNNLIDKIEQIGNIDVTSIKA